MRRREFLAVIGASLAVPLPSVARTSERVRRIGFLAPQPRGGSRLNVFLERLHQLGYREHENFEIEERYADGNAERLPGLAQELVALQPDVILVANTSSAVAMKRATSSIPIVAALIIDPIGAGLTTNEARPAAISRASSSLRPASPASNWKWRWNSYLERGTSGCLSTSPIPRTLHSDEILRKRASRGQSS